MAHIVVGQGRRWYPRAVGVGRRHPAVAVNIVVVTSLISMMVCYPRVRMVRRDVPHDGRHPRLYTEAQILRCVVHPSCAVQPHALQVQGHINLVSRVGIVPIKPDLVVRRIHSLHPYLVDQHVRLNLVVVTAVNHQLLLLVQVIHRPRRLAVREIVD